jgi:hypothetical protein
VLFVAFGLLALVGAGVFYLIRRRSAAKQAASVSWPTCDGTITESYVQTFRDKDRDQNYMARIKFAYRVDGRDYASERVAWGGRPYGRVPIEAQALVDRYPVGSRVAVHYDPRKPREAVLEPKDTGGLTLLTWMWIAFTVIGIAFIAFGLFVPDEAALLRN